MFLKNIHSSIEILKIKFLECLYPPPQNFFVNKAFIRFFRVAGRLRCAYLAEWHNYVKIAKTSAQNVYSCYTKGVQEKLSFLPRTTPNASGNMQACEKILQENLIPNLIGKDNNSH